MTCQFGQMGVFIAWIFYYEFKIKTNIDFPLFQLLENTITEFSTNFPMTVCELWDLYNI